MLRPLPGEAADRVRDDIVTTRPIRHLPAELDSLSETYARVLLLNGSLKQRYREVVFGESA